MGQEMTDHSRDAAIGKWRALAEANAQGWEISQRNTERAEARVKELEAEVGQWRLRHGRLQDMPVDARSALNMTLVQRDRLLARVEAEEAAVARLREALAAAASSLEAIQRNAGTGDDCMLVMSQVRGYARNRAIVARAALAKETP
jgi:hypothetical protein